MEGADGAAPSTRHCFMKRILCYVSGHGFGHAARVCEVLRALHRRRPDVTPVIRSPLARWFFEFNFGPGVEHAHCRLDVGVVQADSLTVDLEATYRAYAAIDADSDRLVHDEVAAAHRPALVLADIPALAFDVAERLGVPGVALANFSWDWIYADYARDLPGFAALVTRLRASYARSTLLLRLPLHGDLSAFPHIRPTITPNPSPSAPMAESTSPRSASSARTAMAG